MSVGESVEKREAENRKEHERQQQVSLCQPRLKKDAANLALLDKESKSTPPNHIVSSLSECNIK